MDYARHLQQCFAALLEGLSYWQSAPFTASDPMQLAWVTEQAPLVARLLELNEQELERLQASDERLLEYLVPYWPQAKQLVQLIQLPRLSSVQVSLSWQQQQRISQSVPGRKWQQIEAFAQSIVFEGQVDHAPFIDACCGKGHLGRYIAALYQTDVLGLDCDASLLRQARGLIDKLQPSLDPAQLRFEQCDVLSEQLDVALKPAAHHLLALHACGNLHRHLLQNAAASGSHNVSLAPCCYHKFYPRQQDDYVFLSAQPLPSAWPGLTLEQVRSCVRQAVTASARERQQSRTLQAWRLGFDQLQRTVRGSQSYLPVPSVSPRLIKLGFVGFARHLAALKHIELPSDAVIAPYESQGWHLYHQVVRLDLMRMAFRRLLEVTLVLDMSCFLQEQGYQCQLGEFCSTQLTPRNILLNASRQHGF